VDGVALRRRRLRHQQPVTGEVQLNVPAAPLLPRRRVRGARRLGQRWELGFVLGVDDGRAAGDGGEAGQLFLVAHLLPFVLQCVAGEMEWVVLLILRKVVVEDLDPLPIEISFTGPWLCVFVLVLRSRGPLVVLVQIEWLPASPSFSVLTAIVSLHLIRLDVSAVTEVPWHSGDGFKREEEWKTWG